MVAADVASLWVVFGGSEVIVVAFPFVFVPAVWGVVVEGDTTSVAPVLPLDPFSTGVGIVGSPSASASTTSSAWVAGRCRAGSVFQCDSNSSCNLLLLLGIEGSRTLLYCKDFLGSQA